MGPARLSIWVWRSTAGTTCFPANLIKEKKIVKNSMLYLYVSLLLILDIWVPWLLLKKFLICLIKLVHSCGVVEKWCSIIRLFSEWKIETGKDEVLCGILYRKQKKTNDDTIWNPAYCHAFYVFGTSLKKPRRNNIWYTALWYCPQFYFKPSCATWLINR